MKNLLFVLDWKTREKIETARCNGKQIGQKFGTKLKIKKKFPVQQLILNYSVVSMTDAN